MTSWSNADPVLLGQIADLVSGRIETEPWDCDIRAILSPLVNRHQAALVSEGGAKEPGFDPYPARAKPLSSLILEDIDYLVTLGLATISRVSGQFPSKPRSHGEFECVNCGADRFLS